MKGLDYAAWLHIFIPLRFRWADCAFNNKNETPLCRCECVCLCLTNIILSLSISFYTSEAQAKCLQEKLFSCLTLLIEKSQKQDRNVPVWKTKHSTTKMKKNKNNKNN